MNYGSYQNRPIDPRHILGLGNRQEKRSPDDPDQGNPQGARGFILWLLLIVLLGVLPAAALIYWGYIVPLTPTCDATPMVPGQICDYTATGYAVAIHHHFTYAQALTYETFRQWVDRVLSLVWVLLTLGFIVPRMRQSAAERDSAMPTPGATPGGGGAAYRRGRMASTLRAIGFVICALGVLALLLVPPEVF